MNKYQEALDNIKSCTNIIIDKEENYTLVKNQVPQECFDSLQELVDKYGAMYEDMIEDAKFLKEVVEPNWKEIYKAKPTIVLQATKNDEFVGNTTIELDKPFWGQISSVLVNGEPLTDFKREINIPKDSKVEIIHYTEFELQKALDKACKELAKLEKLFLDAGGYEEFGCKEERWKEWLLKDE